MPLPKYNPFTFNLYTFDRDSLARMSPEERAELRAYVISDPEEEQRQIVEAFADVGRKMAAAYNKRFMDAFTKALA